MVDKMLSIIGLIAFTVQLVYCQEDVAKAFLDKYNLDGPRLSFNSSEAEWKKATNITEYNKNKSIEASLVWSSYAKELRANASKIKLDSVSADYKRQLNFLVQTASSDDKQIREKFSNLAASMEDIYSSKCANATNKDVKIIPIKDGETKCLSLDPDLTEILRKSNDPEELKFAWKAWRDAVGPKLRPLYEEFVNVANQGAKEKKWKDYGAWLRSWYEVDNLPQIAEGLWNDIQPFYNELHAYVRFKLSKKYPDLVKDGKPIPAHLLGNMWSQSWANIYDLVVPYPNEQSLNIDGKLNSKLKNATGMFEEAERFFVSIGWPKLPNSFWMKSMLTKPVGRDVVCHASAWDFSVNKDVRVKMCTSMNQNDFTTIHHELGHIYYYLLYWNQPYEYRTGANPGFHEAVGDVMALSVQTPKHLHSIGLLDALPENEKSDLNFLLQMALKKIAFIPFGYLVDQWRWRVMSGEFSKDEYNEKWWELRTKYQGITPPVQRSENDFDPGAKYHIPANTPYIRYFISHILQFDFHKAACDASGYKGALHNCSIYQSKAAGDKLKDMLSLGKSKPWMEAYKRLTNRDTMNAKAVEEYFRPLYVWMQEQRKTNGYSLGWVDATPTSTPEPTPEPGSASLACASFISLLLPILAFFFNL